MKHSRDALDEDSFSLGDICECIAIRPVLDEGRSLPLGDELTQPETILHTFLSCLFAFQGGLKGELSRFTAREDRRH